MVIQVANGIVSIRDKQKQPKRLRSHARLCEPEGGLGDIVVSQTAQAGAHEEVLRCCTNHARHSLTAHLFAREVFEVIRLDDAQDDGDMPVGVGRFTTPGVDGHLTEQARCFFPSPAGDGQEEVEGPRRGHH